MAEAPLVAPELLGIVDDTWAADTLPPGGPSARAHPPTPDPPLTPRWRAFLGNWG